MYIYKAGVVGTGTMGAEIAQTISFSGLPVIIKDVNEEALQRGVATVRKIYQTRVDKGKMSKGDMENKMALITTTTSYDAFKEVDIVIEAVPENMGLKKKVFKELDGACPKTAILATNTSALSISELGAVTSRPDKVIGMHFFYPAHVMKLVEVIPGLATSQETVDDVTGFSESLRKIPVRVNECAGFLVNRLLMPYLNEAAYCLQEGAAALRDIDAAMTTFGFPMGPFTLVDNLGIDICNDVVKILTLDYGDRMPPAEIWNALYKAGRLGVKKEAGFYLYGSKAKDEDAELKTVISDIQKKTGVHDTHFSQNRLMLPMINEAALCVQEHVSSATDIDIAMMAGVGFPLSKKGILRHADEIGLDFVLTELEKNHAEFGRRFFPAPIIRRMVGAGFLGVKSKRGFFEYT